MTLRVFVRCAIGNNYYVTKFLKHLQANDHDAFLPDDWSAGDVMYKFMDMQSHREELLDHFTGDDAAPILPRHAVQFLSAAVHQELKEESSKGRKSKSAKLSANYVKTMRSGANQFFRKLGILPKWSYTNNMQTQGNGSPFLSDEVTQFLQALRRQEVQAKTYVPPSNHPITSLDFCTFEMTVAGHMEQELQALRDVCSKVPSDGSMMVVDDDEEEENEYPLGVLEALHEFANRCAWPCMVQTIPQLTRSSCHRGEVYNLKHHELYCEDYGICDEPVITKHSQQGTTSADHNCLTHSGTGPFCNPYAKQVRDLHSKAVAGCYQIQV
jgi:hypothetical protein